jgi:hypothetical protein
MARGGKRPNAGRKRGSLGKATIERKIALEELKARVLKSMHNLLNSQMNLALGVQMLFVIKTDKKGNRSKPQLITDQGTIEKYLAGDLDYRKNEEYYFITTERPDNKALDSLFDRTFGKATQPIDLDPEDNGGFEITIKKHKDGKGKGELGTN